MRLGNGDGPEAVMMRQFLAIQAQFSKNIGNARTRAAMRRKQSLGQRMSKIPPFGQCHDEERIEHRTDGTPIRFWKDDPEEQYLIGLIVKSPLGLHAMASQLNREGWTVRGRKWNHLLVRRIRKRHAYNVEAGLAQSVG